MNNFPAFQLESVVLILLSFMLVLYVNKKTNSKSAALLVTILVFHHIVAYLYAFQIDRPQNEVDPIGFMRLAKECADLGYCGYLGMHLYANYLAKVLSVGQSVYTVFLLNILFFVISLYYFIQIAKFFGLDSNRKAMLILYSMWPSVIYFTTLNYREPFELYLLIAAIYFGLTGSKSDSFLRMLVSMLLLLLMGLFHIKGLIFLAPVLFLILVCYHLPLNLPSLSKKIILLLVMANVAYFSQTLYVHSLKAEAIHAVEKKVDIKDRGSSLKSVEKNNRFEALLNWNKSKPVRESKVSSTPEISIVDSFMNKVISYRAHLVRNRVPRTLFISNINGSNFALFVATYFLVYFEYLFAPFLFQVSSLHGLIAYGESILRLILFSSSLILLKRRPELSILFILYLAITAMWAIGVISYGAAIRHHIQTNWILVLLGTPVIAGYIRNKFLTKNESREIK